MGDSTITKRRGRDEPLAAAAFFVPLSAFATLTEPS
ncbi:hypothetical protein Rrhod_3873 [Rhodococcus rhodnii LMG 5362]|uniref:Uncharacterized protein n=1 Tax=Rhodococcus rhodnii LMG 5362 TaxID=1273125 RepID=R7WI08_9NOCA|nr:hypothetical protein Rrhod_3873 [Rhodococcus rhodnii LMG 5362]